MPPKADRRPAASPKRELAIGLAAAISGDKRKSRSRSIEVDSHTDDDELEKQKIDNASSSMQFHASQSKATTRDQQAGRIADQEADYDSDSFDPAMFDAEEMPDDDVSKKSASDFINGKSGFVGAGYNSLKSFGDQVYSGMAIGGSHTWNYQPGVWKETKKEPDLWEIDYPVIKIRNHKAPAGSGAPVGTEYHWFIVAHQMVKKTDANTYETHLKGHKYKLTHKNVNQKNWDISTTKGQRDREILLLEDAKRRVEGLPPVLSNEKVKIDKKEKGQITLGSFFGGATPPKRKIDTHTASQTKLNSSPNSKKAKT